MQKIKTIQCFYTSLNVTKLDNSKLGGMQVPV